MLLFYTFTHHMCDDTPIPNESGAGDYTLIISYEKKFVFIKLIKVAGSSVENALSPFLGEKAIVTPMALEEANDYWRVPWGKPKFFIKTWLSMLSRHKFKVIAFDLPFDILHRRGPVRAHVFSPIGPHEGIQVAKSILAAEDFRDFLKVAVCRNPYEQIVSWYFWHLYLLKRRSDSSGFVEEPSFKEWFHANTQKCGANYRALTIDGKFAIDFVIRQEYLEEDLQVLCKRVDIDPIPVLEKLAREKLKTSSRPKDSSGLAKNLIDPESKILIDILMDWDFRTFGYEKTL